MSLFGRLHDWVVDAGKAALVTLVEVQGSSPRDAGARMGVSLSGGFTGSIGGGTLEWVALAEAQSLLGEREGATLRLLDKSLGPDLGQCCGGRVRLVLERFGRDDAAWLAVMAEAERQGSFVAVGMPGPGGHYRRQPAGVEDAILLPAASPRITLSDGRCLERVGPETLAVLLFGAGHVARALVMALAPLPVAVDWFDSRDEAFPAHVPQNVRLHRDGAPASWLASGPNGAAVLVMTHSHALDLEICLAALSARRFCFVGVIGSATKRARFATQLRQVGLDERLVGALVCPIGLDGLGGKEPPVIAAGVAAQLLAVRAAHLAQQEAIGQRISPLVEPPARTENGATGRRQRRALLGKTSR